MDANWQRGFDQIVGVARAQQALRNWRARLATAERLGASQHVKELRRRVTVWEATLERLRTPHHAPA